MNAFRAFLSASILFLALMTTHAQEIGFIERFALADDREAILEELIPGTEDYYFFHALHYQNSGDRAKYDTIEDQWPKRFRNSERRKVLQNRQALLDYDSDPEASREYLKEALGIMFDHQRERKETDPNLATTLDQTLITDARFIERTLRNNDSLKKVGAAGIDWLMRQWSTVELTDAQERALLSKLQRPDYPHLVTAVLEDLERRESKGFGEFRVHRDMVRDQLEELASRRPKLLGDESFVHTLLGKLRPGADVDLNRDPTAREQYLTDAWTFVSGLGPAFNSLKAHLLYQRLEHDRKQGTYDRDRFLAYLQLPRPDDHVTPAHREKLALWKHPVDLGFDGSSHTGFGPIRSDHPLVRAYLLHFLADAKDYTDFAQYLKEDFLKVLQAEANIVGGHGDSEQWASQISPSAYQELKDRVDLEFDAGNREQFEADETVTLTLDVKNVSDLIVKLYEINTESYYRNFSVPINTDLNLDGLVANEEVSFHYDESPFKRVSRDFTFPQLDAKRGVWVLEFIGNGKSSRALIRRGTLRYLLRQSSAGQALRIIDEENQVLPEAFITLGSKRFEPNDQGEILIPFSNDAGKNSITLHDDKGFAALDTLTLTSERYSFKAGFYVDREALIANHEATLVVRPKLLLNGLSSDLGILEDAVLTITSSTLDGVDSTATVTDFKLYPHKESTHVFRVPERLASLNFALSASVKNISQGKEQKLTAQESVSINDISRKDSVSDLHLSKNEAGYQVKMLGHNGEPLADRALQITLRRNDFQQKIEVTLKTDAEGTMTLGALEGVDSVQAAARRWNLLKDKRSYPSTLHAKIGETIRIPIVAEEDCTLLETAYGTLVRDLSEKVQVRDGYAELADLPPGDFHLHLNRADRRITIRVSDGSDTHGFILSDSRFLEKANPELPNLRPLRIEGDEVVIKLDHHDATTRVHLLGTRFVPAFSALDQLGQQGASSPLLGTPSDLRNLYVSGRAIGDEYRYIIERRYATAYPGNMLGKPGLILNPWALRDTSTGQEEAAAGGDWIREAEPETSSMLRKKAKAASQRRAPSGLNDSHDLDFLAYPSITAYNLAPNEDGEIRVKLADLRDCSHLRVLAANTETTIERHLALPQKALTKVDRRLADGLNPKRHFIRQDQVTLLEPGNPFVIEDALSTSFETYRTLGDVFQLFRTLSKSDTTLETFSFILGWPDLDGERKRALYSEHACHELSFFLQRKDPEFFSSVIRPYLANKKDKTFMDAYLLELNLEEYLQPWHFQRLNVVERTLLASRLIDQKEAIVRDVQDWLALLPPEERLELTNFDIALGVTFMDTESESLSLGAIKQDLRRMKRQSSFSSSVEASDGDFAAPAPMDVKAPFGDMERLEERVLEEAQEQVEDRLERNNAYSFFRKLETTKEWAENNYYHLPIADQNRELVTVTSFWNDFAQHQGTEGPFLSKHLTQATRSFTEMMLALSVTDLPHVVDDEGEASLEGTRLTLNPKQPTILFHKEIREAEAAGQGSALLVSQHFFEKADRYRQVNGEQTDKFVTKEFLMGTVYGCQVAVTNPTSSSQRLELLLQIPDGAHPIAGGRQTTSSVVRLEPYQTHTQEYAFYFPAAGDFAQFPVHVSQEDKVVAFAAPASFAVVEELSETDTNSWAHVSQWGSEEEVLAFLEKNNLHQLELSKVAWRLRESHGFFNKVVALLDRRHHYDFTVFSYALLHGETKPLHDFLAHADGFVANCGDALDSTLLTIDPIERRAYQHLDYTPLVNARAYSLGGKRKILNAQFLAQYQKFMSILSYRAQLDDADRMTLTVYLLLQDRITEALATFATINREALTTQIQADYLRAYLAFYQEDLATARNIADAYVSYPVDRWKARFQEIQAQLDELEGKAPNVIDSDDRDQQQNQLAAKDPSLTFKVENQQIDVISRNVREITLNYYKMDLEFLFSTAPFVSSDSARFSMIKPNRSDRLNVDDTGRHSLALPEEFAGENVLVEVLGGGLIRSQAYYSNSLQVNVATNYGQLQVSEASGEARPLSKVYVKVYAEVDGTAQFYKDGYTDLRGKFDYASLSTDEQGRATRYSILVMSENHGALVTETVPPQR